MPYRYELRKNPVRPISQMNAVMKRSGWNLDCSSLPNFVRPAQSAQIPASPLAIPAVQHANGVRWPGRMTIEGRSGRIWTTAMPMPTLKTRRPITIRIRAPSLSRSSRSP